MKIEVKIIDLLKRPEKNKTTILNKTGSAKAL